MSNDLNNRLYKDIHKNNQRNKMQFHSKGKFNKHKGKSSTNEMKEIISDPRFSHVAADPRYRNVPNKEIKIHIDNRFKAALTNENFSTKPILDPRGRPKSYGTKGKLDKFYDLQSSEDDKEKSIADSDEDSEKEEELKTTDTIRHSHSESSSPVKQHTENTVEEAEVGEKFLQCLLDPERDLARGEAFYPDDSSDDDSTTTDEEVEDLGEFEWGELDKDAQWDLDGNEVEETRRLAVCDMDWDRVKAMDLMVLFSSFLPAEGVVQKVTIYQSEYGKARMKEEEVLGPQELVKLAARNMKGHIDDYDDLDKIQKGTLDESTAPTAHELEALRRYQRNRLRYFYAVVEFDSVETAKAIYKECDRTHYEVAGVTLDLRYIPSDMEFDEIPHDECQKVPAKYESESFQTTALVDAKPTLTWDETDQRRKKILSTVMTKALKKQNFDEEALKEYVACSDDEDSNSCEEDKEEEEEEEEEGKEERIAKFRALILEIDEKEQKKRESAIDMEATFDVGEREDKDETEEKNKEEEEEENLTPFEKFLMKKKKKRKERMKKRKIGKNEEREIENEEGYETGESESREKIEVSEEVTQTKSSSLNSEQDRPSRNSRKLKKKEKRKKSHAHSLPATSTSDLSLLVMDEEKEEKKHFNMRKILEEKRKHSETKHIKKRKKTEGEVEPYTVDNFKVDSSDPRFAALFSHRNFNLDPSHPKYDPHSALNLFVSQTSKKQKTAKQGQKHHRESESKSLLDPTVVDLIQKMKKKVSKLK